MTFCTGSRCSLPCRLDWAKPLPNPSWPDISPHLPSPSHPPSDRFHSPSLSLSFSTPPAFKHRPKTQDPAERKRLLETITAARAAKEGEENLRTTSCIGGLRGGAMALGSRRSSLTFARGVGPVFFILQIISVRADGESPLCSGWVAGAGRGVLC